MSGTSRIAVAVVVALLAQARIEGQDSRAGGSAAMRIRSGGAESRGVVAQPRAMPAAQRIRWAEGAAAKDPKNASAWNALAMAHARRARETGNPDHYARAMDALDKSFAAAPENYEGLRTKAWVLLGQHEFAKAREVALKLNKSAPDDVLVYGLLTDANIELGNYDEAEKAAQWMLDMRPGNVPGLTRGAYLRELFGDVPGAIEFMSMAFDQTSEQEIEDRAWMMTHIAHLHLETGKLETAATAIARALELVPDYHYALAQLGKLRVAQGKHDEAADVFRKHYEIAPHPENRYEWACALLLAGRKDEASTNFAAFEKQALAESEGVDNANRELIAYWLEHAGKPVEALALATNEIKRRHDVLTLDAYAWALFHNKRFAEARKQIDAAMKVGVRDARILYHAAAICAKLADHDAARTLLAHALATNPHATVAPSARSLLAELERDPKSTSAR